MKLFKLWRDTPKGWDYFDSCIVAALNEEEAKTIKPKPSGADEMEDWEKWKWWVPVEEVKCEYIGEAAEGIERGVVLASYNAG